MNIHLSTATVFAYENTQKSMNLHFHPIVMFEKECIFERKHLKNVSWKISADAIGTHIFDEIGVYYPFEAQNGKNYIKFELKKMYLPFQHDDYECQITFTATLDLPYSFPVEIEYNFWGVVITTWSRGLQ